MTDTTPIVHESDCEGFRDDRGKEEGICISICMIHMECEPSRDGDFCFCPECFHVFRTPKELVDAHMEAMKRVEPHYFVRPAATDIHSCPLCAHDF